MQNESKDAKQTARDIERYLSDKSKPYGGKAAGAYLVVDAYHACIPSEPYTWTAEAVLIDGLTVSTGQVFWDFSEYVASRGREPEDAGDYPWDDDDLASFRADMDYDLTDVDDRVNLMEMI